MNQYKYLADIKSKSPGTRVLGYKSATEMADDCGTTALGREMCDSGITYQEAQAHDAAFPSDPWILRNASGQSMTAPAYPHAHLANVGSASYQAQWLSNVTAAVKKYGYDGVFIDSVLGIITAWSGGVHPTMYPNDAAWEDAMKSFMAANGPKLKAQGLYVLSNTFKAGPNNGDADIAWWKSIAPYVSGMLAEYWEQAWSGTLFDTNPCCWTGHYLNWLTLADAAQLNNADFYGGMKGAATNTRTMQYGRASFYLVWNGKGGGFLWQDERRLRPLEPRLDNLHRHPPRRPLHRRRRPPPRLHRRHRPRQPQPLLLPDLQPRRQLHHPQRQHRHQRHPLPHHRHGPQKDHGHHPTPPAAPAARHPRRPRRLPRLHLRRARGTSSWSARRAAGASPSRAHRPPTGRSSGSSAARAPGATIGSWLPPAAATTRSSTATAANASTSPPSPPPTAHSSSSGPAGAAATSSGGWSRSRPATTRSSARPAASASTWPASRSSTAPSSRSGPAGAAPTNGSACRPSAEHQAPRGKRIATSRREIGGSWRFGPTQPANESP